MKSSVLISLLCVLVAACGFDAEPEVESVTATRGSLIALAVEGGENESVGHESIYWLLVERPSESRAFFEEQDRFGVMFRVDRTGLFVVDRWLQSGTTENWTHRFFIEARDRAPTARITAPAQALVGDSILLNGNGSLGTSLEYRWQLTSRPFGSTATLTTNSTSISGFVADEPGNYTVELDVFDGVQWSEQPDRLRIVVN